jgi:hypothetical protein
VLLGESFLPSWREHFCPLLVARDGDGLPEMNY